MQPATHEQRRAALATARYVRMCYVRMCQTKQREAFCVEFCRSERKLETWRFRVLEN